MLYVRDWDISDCDRLVELLNDARLDNLQIPRPYTVAHAEEFILRNCYRHHYKPDFRSNAIIINHEVVGQVSLTKNTENPDTAYIGVWIGSDYSGRGYASEAIRVFLYHNYFFEYPEVYGGYSSLNPASRRVMEKAGFSSTGETYEIPYEGSLRILNKMIMKRPCDKEINDFLTERSEKEFKNIKKDKISYENRFSKSNLCIMEK